MRFLLAAALGALVSATPIVGQVSVELLWEVGSIDGPDDQIFMYISDGVITSGGLFVLAGGGEVRQYGLDGTFLRRLGRSGQGPGEFLTTTSIRLLDQTVEIHDQAQRRMVVFSLDGEVLETRSAQSLGDQPSALQPVWPRAQLGTIPQIIDAEVEDGYSYYVRLREGGTRDTIFELPAYSVLFRFDQNPFRLRSGVGTGPGGAVEVLGDSLLVVMDGTESNIRLLSLDAGELVESGGWSLPRRPVAVSRDQSAWLEESVQQRFGEDPRIGDFRVPGEWSAWTALEDGRDGSIWLSRGGPQHHHLNQGFEVWERWSLDGKKIEEVGFPRRVSVLSFSGDLVLARRLDELDVHYLQLYELRR